MMDFATACMLYLAYASTTRFLILVETDKYHVVAGYIRMTPDFLRRYCYVDESRQSLRFNPTRPQAREIVALMDNPIELNIRDYKAMVAPYLTYVNREGKLCKANRGDQFERLVFERWYGLDGWYHNTRPHIYGGDIPAERTGLNEDIEVKTGYNSTFMTFATYNNLRNRAGM